MLVVGEGVQDAPLGLVGFLPSADTPSSSGFSIVVGIIGPERSQSGALHAGIAVKRT
jgi:hypothetical protein